MILDLDPIYHENRMVSDASASQDILVSGKKRFNNIHGFISLQETLNSLMSLLETFQQCSSSHAQLSNQKIDDFQVLGLG